VNWNIELIPGEDNLFLRIHSNLLRLDFDFTKKKIKEKTENAPQ